MHRAVLTLLIGLMLSLGGGVRVFASGDVIWEGVQTDRVSGDTLELRLTTEGIFWDGQFKRARNLSQKFACIYGLSGFPEQTKFVVRDESLWSRTWTLALNKFDFHECVTERLRAATVYKFEEGLLHSPNNTGFTETQHTSVSAHALVLNCERTTESHDAFSTQQVFESWFPRHIRPTADDQVPASKDTQVRFQINGVIYDLTPSKWMAGRLPEKAGYKSVTGVRYKCNASSNQIKGAYRTQAASASSMTGSSQVASASTNSENANWTDREVCNLARRLSSGGVWEWENVPSLLPRVAEAKRRGLTCGVGASGPTKAASINASNLPACPLDKSAFRDNCFGTFAYASGHEYVGDFKDGKKHGKGTLTYANGHKYVGEFKDNVRHGKGILSFADGRAAKEGVWKDGIFQYAVKLIPIVTASEVESSTNNQASTATSEALIAAQQKADDERQKRLQAEAELAALKTKRLGQQQAIANDNEVPFITIVNSATDQRKGIIRGFARDNVQIAEVLVDGSAVNVASDGSFEWTGFVPPTGKEVTIEAIDIAALSTREVVRLERGQTLQKAILRFDELNPMSGKIAQENHNALALIVGISKYDRTNAPAVFADNDAQFFRDYAALKLGIPENNITTLINGNAEQADVLLSTKNWLSRAVKQEQSDVYVFFAGHGLASDDGKQMFLLPYDGAPELLEDTAVSRERLFTEIAAANPHSVTVFLDTCYSGTTRGTDMLIASRPIAIRAKEQALPEGFTVMTAAAGDQTAKPLEEAKHGMFSYFLMKGMEGDADANQDNQITAGELHEYVQQNVIQQSSGSQTPELQGDADRVLVRFQ